MFGSYSSDSLLRLKLWKNELRALLDFRATLISATRNTLCVHFPSTKICGLVVACLMSVENRDARELGEEQ